MEKTKQLALSAVMREHSVTVNELTELIGIIKNYGGVPQISTGETLPLELRYEDNSVSKTVQLGKKAVAVHSCGLDVSLHEPSVPLPFDAAVKYCAQKGLKLLPKEKALILCAHKALINSVMEQILAEPLREYVYWLDGRASRPYLAVALDLRTGSIREFRKTESFRVRPVNF